MSLFSEEAVSYVVHPGDTAYRIAQRFGTTVNALAAANPGVNLNNLFVGQVITILKNRGNNASNTPVVMGITRSQLELNNIVRSLWEQHIFWTRIVIAAMVYDQPDVNDVTARLLRNPKDFAQALRPFYSEKTLSRFTELFTAHLVIAAQLVAAAKEGDTAKAEQAEKDWYANADQIAAFLASINPFWSERTWKDLLYEHLRMTKDEAVALLTGEYEKAITLLDAIEQQALKMADVMTAGIIRQFPARFSK